MELKAVAAKGQDVDQLLKYRDQLIAQGKRHVFMWLVATHIPPSIRDFLDHFGIRYSEIHIGDYRAVAERHGIQVKTDTAREASFSKNDKDQKSPKAPMDAMHRAEPRILTGPQVTDPSRLQWKAYGYDLSLRNSESVDSPLFTNLIGEFERAVPSRRNAALVQDLKRWVTNPGSEIWQHQSNRSLLRWVTTNSYKAAVPHAHAIWKYLFGGPAPTWYVWTQARGYQFDSQGWTVWFDSLNSAE